MTCATRSPRFSWGSSCSGAARTKLGHVRSSAERAQRLIEDLLDFTQARVGEGLAVKLQPMNLHELTGRTIDELRLAFPDREILHFAHGPSECIADMDRLAQMIGNLVSNAATYGRLGMPIVVQSEVNGPMAKLSVRNQGQPIPPPLLPDIFEPMVRGVTGSSTIRSVGLGLFIVREIAKSHRGEMKVESTADEGTIFTLLFPAGAS
jgi:sigma-B regulation protein RsbU (phosphoserine phosphatase)